MNGNKIIVEDKKVQNARVYLTYATSEVLKQNKNVIDYKTFYNNTGCTIAKIKI